MLFCRYRTYMKAISVWNKIGLSKTRSRTRHRDYSTICQAILLFLNIVIIPTGNSLFSTMLNPPNRAYKSAEYNWTSHFFSMSRSSSFRLFNEDEILSERFTPFA